MGGQALWRANLARAFSALAGALFQGFSTARFAVVLDHAGYAQDPLTTFYRFRSTAGFVLDWFIHQLNDPASVARRSLYTVRCMHTFARRRSNRLFSKPHGEGIALSQYDLGEVQLGFSAVCLLLMEVAVGMEPVAMADREAMVHVWRLIGWHLGIKDEFNVCRSVEYMSACMEDYMIWMPQRLRTCRPVAHVLQKSVIQGFGRHSGLGERYYEGFFSVFQTVRGMEAATNSFFQPLPGMTEFVRRRTQYSDDLNKFVSHHIERDLHVYRSEPESVDRFHEVVAPRIAYMNDLVLWRSYSIAFRLARLMMSRRAQASSMVLVIGLVFQKILRATVLPKRQ